MNWDQIQGDWKQLAGKVKEKGSSGSCGLELRERGHAVLVIGVTTKQFQSPKEAACPGGYCITGSAFGAIVT